MLEYANDKEIPYFKCAELLNQMEMLMRLINTVNVEQSRIAITTLYHQLEEEIKPILLEGNGKMPKYKSDLYRSLNGVMHVQSGLTFDSINDIPKHLIDDDLETLGRRQMSVDGNWKKVKKKISWLNR